MAFQTPQGLQNAVVWLSDFELENQDFVEAVAFPKQGLVRDSRPVEL